ncbi:DUF4491 family protein [Konateibacter massiliensis]|uniref:DUF4491 family protein n=1 Tax=Konateibacter massiliensis TaxID=2002841 RepID=UPI000C15FA7C|nr:DUF4491 family protein [Konateibacter massiliensis]
MHVTGLIIGIAAFIIIGVFHPIVIKCEYYFSDKIWPVFLIIGIITIVSSCLIREIIISSILGIFGCTCIWSIIELKEQRERVRKGWFPKNPKRKI